MSNSKLVDYVKISPNSNPRIKPITKITIHYMAGNATIEAVGNWFAKKSTQASSNYGIGSDGRVALYVDESRRSWASSSPSNDHCAVTIEVANYPDSSVSDKALAKLIDLCVDICQRNGIKKLNFTGDKSGNLTMHKWFAATDCPGAYLESKFPYIAEQVNKRLSGEVEKEDEVKKGDYELNMRLLQKGCKGEDVRALQILLMGRNIKLPKYGADGDFGAETETAVREYQRKNNLTVDGIAGQQTMSSLLGV